MEQDAKFVKTFSDPFLMWTDLTKQLNEMVWDSWTVMGCRTAGLLAIPVCDPRMQPMREVNMMVQEKFDASAESAQAVAIYFGNMNRQFGKLTVDNILAVAAAMNWPVGGFAPLSSLKKQVKLAHTIGRSMATVAELPDSVVRLARQSIEPFSLRVAANAKRLGGRQ